MTRSTSVSSVHDQIPQQLSRVQPRPRVLGVSQKAVVLVAGGGGGKRQCLLVCVLGQVIHIFMLNYHNNFKRYYVKCPWQPTMVKTECPACLVIMFYDKVRLFPHFSQLCYRSTHICRPNSKCLWRDFLTISGSKVACLRMCLREKQVNAQNSLFVVCWLS